MLRNTHSASRSTVLAIQTTCRRNSAAARAYWAGSSPATKRTTTLVSTASMTPLHFLGYGPVHLFDCLRPACVMQAAGYLLEACRRKDLDWAQEHTIGHLLY